MIDVHAYFRLQTGQVTKQMINEPYLASSPKGGTYGSLCTWNVSDDGMGMHLWIPHVYSLTQKDRVGQPLDTRKLRIISGQYSGSSSSNGQLRNEWCS